MLSAASTAYADPLPTRNQNPLLAGFGIPTPLAARGPDSAWSFAADLNWASTALVQTSATETLIADAETRELRLSLAHRISETWSVEVQLPYRELSGGTLDSFIDSWHDVFGLPEGARRSQPKDRLGLHYVQNGSAAIDVSDDIQGLGDLSVTFGHQLVSTPQHAVRAGVSIKAPTGENNWFTSSGAFDVSALIAAEKMFADRWTLYGQAAVTALGEGDLLRQQQRDFVWSGQAGLHWQAFQPLRLTLQADAHTRVFEGSGLDYFRNAIVATLGGSLRLRSGWQFTFGVSEDIMVEHSPDVVFVVGLRSNDRL